MAEDEFQREQSFGYLINLAGRLLGRKLEQRLLAHGVSLGPFPILLALWEEENLTQSEIARRLQIEQPTVANTLKRMARDGLVAAAPDPDNARQVLFRLTERARALEDVVKAEAVALNDEATADLTGAEREAFRAALGRVIRRLEA